MATDISQQTQIVREAPEIEAHKRALLESSLAQVNAINQAAQQGRYLTPDFQVAGMSQNQLDAIQAAQAGIGAYQPYLQRGAQLLGGGADVMGEAAGYMRGADTRAYFPQAFTAMQAAQTPLNAMTGAAQMVGQGLPYVQRGEQGLQEAQRQAQQYAQANLAPSQGYLERSVGAMRGAGPSFGAAEQMLRQGVQQGMGAAQLGPFERMAAPERVAAERVGAPQMQAAQTQFQPNLQTFQMGPAAQVTTSSFAQPGSAEAFMSPYVQSVVERQQQAAQREADVQRQTLGAQFAQAGAFGGGRFGVQQARAAEALARQKGDIQAAGLQQAFQQAQQQFNTEQQARLAAQQANQAAGLQVGGQNLAAQLGVQQLGTQTGLQTALANLSSQQQANVQNQAAQLQAQGMNSQQALQAALANQQAGMSYGQFTSAQDYNRALQNAQLGMQAGQLGMQGAQQLAGMEGTRSQAAQEAARYMGNVGQTLGSQQLQQAGLGQSAAGQYGQFAGQQAGLANILAQLGGQQANIFGQQAGLQQQLGQGIGSLAGQQFNIGQGMAQGMGALGAQQAGMGLQAGQLGQLAQGMGQGDVNFLYNLGAMQQRQQQSILDAQRQNQLNQNMQPMQMLGFLSDIYKGAPSSQMAMTQQSAPTPSPFQQVAGLGIAGVSTAAAANKAGLL